MLLPLLVVAQNKTWQRITVGDSTTAIFPGKPKERQLKGTTAYGLYQDGTVYSVGRQEDASDAEATLSEKSEFYNKVFQGALDKAGGGEIRGKRMFNNSGFTGMEARLVTPKILRVPDNKYMRLLIVNKTLYSIGYWTNDTLSEDAIQARHHFFNGFRSRAHPVASTPADTRTFDYKLGQFLGTLFFYGGLLALIIYFSWRKKTVSSK